MSEDNTLEAGVQPELPEWLREATDDSPETPAGQVQQRVSTFGVVGILISLGVLLVIFYALYQRSQETPNKGPAPHFAVTMFDYDQIAMTGQHVELKDLRGQVVVINFWASYCEPCKVEAPMLERVWQDYKGQGVVMLGIDTNDPLKNALDYLEEYGITYPNAPDQGGRLEDDYRITGIPETFVVNKQGEIVEHYISTPNESDLRNQIERALES
jgi:cytochrome c biogenesis protein CcmG, thiol:disulfide interchange protein DsbE